MKIISFVIILFIICCLWGWKAAYQSYIFSPGHNQAVEHSTKKITKNDEAPEKSRIPWIDMSAENIIQRMGYPERKDPSEYGYEWWVYGIGQSSYLQIGMFDNKVVTVLLFEEGIKVKGFEVGRLYTSLVPSGGFDREFAISQKGAGDYRLELTNHDLLERPLISINENWSSQLYFDAETTRLSAIRLVRNDVLLKLQPYKVVYRGDLPKSKSMDRFAWHLIEKGMEEQILAMTNLMRERHGKEHLQLHEKASQAAFLHSKDMNENNYFSHYDPTGEGLKERIKDITYVKAGENIAAQYIDAAAAVHGWLNSKDHRKTLMDQEFTHIGIGVHQRYYTQNFLTIP